MRVTWTKRDGPYDMWDGVIEGSLFTATVTDITCGDYEVAVRDPNQDPDDPSPVFVDWVCHADPADVLQTAEEWISRELRASVS
jgi:hypothetical protein